MLGPSAGQKFPSQDGATMNLHPTDMTPVPVGTESDKGYLLHHQSIQVKVTYPPYRENLRTLGIQAWSMGYSRPED
jgi:hypothetical protein